LGRAWIVLETRWDRPLVPIPRVLRPTYERCFMGGDATIRLIMAA
jgi:hypothetical protein